MSTTMKDRDVYFEADPQFCEEDFSAWVELTAALRRLMDTSTKLRGRKQIIQSLTEKVNQLETELAAHKGQRPVSAFAGFNPHRVARTSPFCPIMGELSPLAPPVELFFEGDKVVGTVTFDDIYQGPPNCVHGGIVAKTWDLVLAYANMTKKIGGPTAYITIHYRQLTPLHKPLRFEACLDRLEGKKIYTKGVCYCEGEIVTEAEALFINTIDHMYAVESARVQSD